MAVENTERRSSIVERVNEIPMVNMAVNVANSQYTRLRQSNETVGGVISQAEKVASSLWDTVRPIVNKLQQPLDLANRMACQTLDFVESKVPSIKKSPQELIEDSKMKYSQVVEQSSIFKMFKVFLQSLQSQAHRATAAQ